MVKRILYVGCAILILSDLTLSFVQFLHQPLDGDIARNLVPEEGVKPVFESPFGIKAIREDIRYSNPNRFFSHWIYRAALIELPGVFRQWTDPVSSVYFACATWKTLFQLSLILLLAFAITGSLNLQRLEFILAAVLVTPFFQTNGYSDYMAIIDPSITYSFFYALPIIFLIIYLLPLFVLRYHRHLVPARWVHVLIGVPLAVVVCLSGPLNPAIILVLSVLVLFHYFFQKHRAHDGTGVVGGMVRRVQSIPAMYLIVLVPAGVLSIYSLYLGTYNAESASTGISLAEMYGKLPVGIYLQFTQKLGFPVLFGVLILNVFLVRKYLVGHVPENIGQLCKWIALFSLVYILLLPLGGYRVYRPHILRYDTILPITLSLVFLFGLTTLSLINGLPKTIRRYYLPILVVVLFVFTNADELEAGKADCERSALAFISSSRDSVVVIPRDCPVVAWNTFHQPEESHLNGQLLKMWGITRDVKLYVNQ